MPDPATDRTAPAERADRAVVFDLDGTLVDSSHDITRPVNAMLADHGLPGLAPAQVEPLLGKGARSLVAAVVGGDALPVRKPDPEHLLATVTRSVRRRPGRSSSGTPGSTPSAAAGPASRRFWWTGACRTPVTPGSTASPRCSG